MSIYKGETLIAGTISDVANQSLSNLNATGEKHFINKTQITNCILEAPNGVATHSSGAAMAVPEGLKVLVPNGRNDDGSLKNIEVTTTTVKIGENPMYNAFNGVLGLTQAGNLVYRMYLGEFLSAPNPVQWHSYYNITENLFYYSSDGSTWTRDTQFCILAKFSTEKDSASISAFNASLPISLANVQDLDGYWTYKPLNLVLNQTWAANTNYTFDLSSYLPNDGIVYEVIFNVQGTTPATIGNYLRLTCKTDIIDDEYAYNAGAARCATNGQGAVVSNSIIVIVGAGRYVTLMNVSTAPASYASADVKGYRKVR